VINGQISAESLQTRFPDFELFEVMRPMDGQLVQKLRYGDPRPVLVERRNVSCGVLVGRRLVNASRRSSRVGLPGDGEIRGATPAAIR